MKHISIPLYNAVMVEHRTFSDQCLNIFAFHTNGQNRK